MEIDITVLEFRLSAKEEIRLPKHPGSTFRGAFGHGLYNICCSIKNKTCDKCNLKSACAYSILFNPFLTEKEKSDSSSRFHNKPRPFIIKYPLKKQRFQKRERIEFKITLFGYIKNFIPFIVESWRYLQGIGLGSSRGKFLLDEVWITNEIVGNSERIYYSQDKKIHNKDITITSSDIKERKKIFEGKNSINILLETPMLLKYHGNYVKKLSFSILIQNLFRRLSSLSFFYGTEKLELNFRQYIDDAGKIQIKNNQTKWIQWKRLSNRQKCKINMNGLIGEITYLGNIDKCLEYLIWGQYMNIGKNTAFAQGAYRLLA